MRIYRWPYKLLYVFLAWLVGRVTGVSFGLTETPEILTSVWECVYTLGAFVAGARIFRVAGESPAPRSWWKMTGRPSLSKVLGVLFVGVAVLYGLIFVFVPLRVLSNEPVLELRVSGLLGITVPFAVLAGLYLYSRRRLLAQELATPEVIAARTRLRSSPRRDPVDEANDLWLEASGVQDDVDDAGVHKNAAP